MGQDFVAKCGNIVIGHERPAKKTIAPNEVRDFWCELVKLELIKQGRSEFFGSNGRFKKIKCTVVHCKTTEEFSIEKE